MRAFLSFCLLTLECRCFLNIAICVLLVILFSYLGSVWEEGREWNGIKGIFLEYSSLLLFGSFNGVNGMYIPLFGSLSGREWNG